MLKFEFDYATNDPATDKDIAAYEAASGYDIPEELKEFFKLNYGGYGPISSIFYHKDRRIQTIESIFSPTSGENSTYKTLEQIRQYYKVPNFFLPIADALGGELVFGCDLRENTYGQIISIYFDEELDFESDINWDEKIVRECEDLGKFLSFFITHEEYDEIDNALKS